jgi:hypothetical protein
VWIHVPIAGKETWPVTTDAISNLKKRKYTGIILQASNGLPDVLRATCSDFGAAGIDDE